MINLTINNQTVSVAENVTILEAAEQIGLKIPTLCFVNDGCGEGGSCMICAVKDELSGNLIPSCSAKAQDGMNLTTDSEELNLFRKTTMEMLLAEHIGDCVAPCQLACPKGLNIPKILHLCVEQKFNAASELIPQSHSCDDCLNRCEKACRRKRLDRAVSIKEIVSSLKGTGSLLEAVKGYNHRFGKVSEDDFQQFIKECSDSEAGRCLHCECRANDNCKLKGLATEFVAKQNRFKVQNNNSFSKELIGELVFEPGKCIKCGRCIAKAESLNKLSPVFYERGFELSISHPIGHNWKECVGGIEEKLAKVCPTGAFSMKN